MLVLADVVAGRMSGDDFMVIRLLPSESGATRSDDDVTMIHLCRLVRRNWRLCTACCDALAADFSPQWLFLLSIDFQTLI